MKNANIDNSITAQNVILWQYDNATNFISLVTVIEQLFVDATESFWNEFMSIYDSVEGAASNIDVCSDYGLAVWGIVLGVRRPFVTVGSGSSTTVRPIERELYRDVLKARFVLSLSGSSVSAINAYLSSAFRAGNASVTENANAPMTLTYAYDDPDAWETGTEYEVGDKVKSGTNYYRCTEAHTSSGSSIDETKFLDVTSRHADESYLFQNQSDYATYFPAGVRDNSTCSYKFFGFDGQRGTTASPVTNPIATNFNGTDKATFFDTNHWEFAGYGYDPTVTYVVTSQTVGSVTTWTLTAKGGEAGVQSESVTGPKQTYLNEMSLWFEHMNIIASWCKGE